MSSRRKLILNVKGQPVDENSRHERMSLVSGQLLATSPIIRQTNFTSLHPDDLRLLFELYDETFFDGHLNELLKRTPISFRVSPRMTKAGGKTTRWGDPRRSGNVRYEIAVSSTLLFQSFQDPERNITVTGLECSNRLEALMRVMEHELVHLIEMLLWFDSNCSAQRFQTIANRQFGHTDHRHDLMTVQEAASRNFGLQPGVQVRFRFEGKVLTGIVNRITKRATILVPDRNGQPYSDGKSYSKYYIPIHELEVVE